MSANDKSQMMRTRSATHLEHEATRTHSFIMVAWRTDVRTGLTLG